MRIDPNFVQGLVGAVDQAQANEQTYTNEISTGVSVNSLSDNPVAAAQDYLLRSEISVNDSFVQSASTMESQMQVTDTALAGVVTQLNSAISLATEGNNGTLNASDVQSISTQLSGILDEVVSLANSSYQGQYLFGGSQTQTPPFSLNTGTTPATVNYTGDSDVLYSTTPSGQQIQVNLPGNQVFGSGTTGVIAALSQMVSDFSTGVPSSTSVEDAANLTTALQTVSQQRVVLDNGLNRLQSNSTYTQSETTQLQVAQNAEIQADPSTVATELSQAETQNTSLLDMIASLDAQPTLFSMLH
ncbi:MAG TPA: flagellar hook-associated protein FlgL [Acidobacteriaceae bacterium]|jgi:flagellar hook-associated protein 3 FlgL|nr:flagellar hook-associated protein FlgL [Acidobacteriaceae bacterium]